MQPAKKIASSCVGDQLFRRIFDKPDESIRRALEQSTCEPMKNLWAAINDFEDSLRSWNLPDESDPFFAIVFDEVGSLMDETGNGRFIALNRVISVISERHKIWYLFLSTESRLDALLPPDQVMPQGSGPNRPSSRLIDCSRVWRKSLSLWSGHFASFRCLHLPGVPTCSQHSGSAALP